MDPERKCSGKGNSQLRSPAQFETRRGYVG
jgi:hypothetical protein